MKIKGLKNKKVQVTYTDNYTIDHPTSGTVFTISWSEMKRLVEDNFKDKRDQVISFRATELGVDVFLHTQDMTTRYPMKKSFTGDKIK